MALNNRVSSRFSKMPIARIGALNSTEPKGCPQGQSLLRFH